MARKEHHIVPDSKGWAVKKGGGEKAIQIFETKKEAEKAGREISKNQQSELVIHGKDGKIQRSDSHGKDPCPPTDSN